MKKLNFQIIGLYIPLALMLIMSLWMIGFRDIESNVILSAIDDGLYYPKIAHNFVNTGKVSYDNITVTNGFHPLWETMLVPVFFIFNSSTNGLMATYWLIIIIIMLAVFVYIKIHTTLKMEIPGLILSSIILFFNMRSFTLWFSLLESHLYLLLILISILFYTRQKFNKPIELGVICGFMFLSRTDSIFICLTLGVFAILHSLRTKKFSAPLLYALGFSIISIPYMITNFVFMGHILPVSGARKITLSAKAFLNIFKAISGSVRFVTSRFADYSNTNEAIWIIALILFITCIVVALAILKRNKSLSQTSQIIDKIAPFIIGTLIHYIFIAAFMTFEAMYSFWYIVSEIVIFSIVLSAIISDISVMAKNQEKLMVFCSMAILLIIVFAQCMLYSKFIDMKYMQRIKLDFAKEIEKSTSEDETFVMFDSGVVSYFSNRNFVTGNGLAGDFELAEMLNYPDYFNRMINRYSIDYIVIIVNDKTNINYEDNYLLKSAKVPYFNSPNSYFILMDSEKYIELNG